MYGNVGGGLRDAGAAGGGEVLPQQAGRTAERIVEVAERRFPDPLPAYPGIEGVVATETDLDDALEPRLPCRDRAQRRPGIDQDAAASYRQRELRPCLFEPPQRKPVLREELEDRPCAGCRLRLVEPLEVQVGETEL